MTDDIKRYIEIVNESSKPTKSDKLFETKLDEAKPMDLWQKLKAKVNLTDKGRNARIETGEIANEEYSEWLKYLGSLNLKENQGKIGDLKKFFETRGFPMNVVDQVIKTTMPQAADASDEDNITLSNIKGVAQLFMKIIIATRRVIGPDTERSSFGSRGFNANKKIQQQQPNQIVNSQMSNQHVQTPKNMTINDVRAAMAKMEPSTLANLIDTLPDGERNELISTLIKNHASARPR